MEHLMLLPALATQAVLDSGSCYSRNVNHLVILKPFWMMERQFSEAMLPIKIRFGGNKTLFPGESPNSSSHMSVSIAIRIKKQNYFTPGHSLTDEGIKKMAENIFGRDQKR
jgi:hypothetical protein